MGLIQNGYRHNAIGKLFGGTNLDGANPSVHEYRGHRTGAMRNQFAGEGIDDDLASVPNGARHPVAWVMAPKNGGMASRNVTTLDIATSGLAYGGITTTGSTTITIGFDPAAGQLISSGSGAASMSFSFASALLTASLNGTGSAAFTLVSNTPLLGAKASAIGSATFTFTGTMTPYAIGSMTGSTVDNSVLTVDAIAAGILAAALTTPIAADIRKVNTVTVNGIGTPASPWGP